MGVMLKLLNWGVSKMLMSRGSQTIDSWRDQSIVERGRFEVSLEVNVEPGRVGESLEVNVEVGGVEESLAVDVEAGGIKVVIVLFS